MEGKDPIKDLFSRKLGNFEVPVNPELWSSIASQIPTVTSAATASTGVSLATKVIIGLSVVASLATGVYFIQSDENKQTEKVTPKISRPFKTDEQEAQKDQNKINEISKNNVNNKSLEIKSFSIPNITPHDIEVKNESKLDNSESITYSGQDKSASKIISQVNNTSKIQESQRVVKVDENVNDKANDTSTVSESKNQNSPSNLNQNLIPKESAIQLTLPNIFTPNGDGANDYLEMRIDGVSEFSVVVLNESGQVVYQSQETDFKWDGSLSNGDKAPQGSYVYYITGKDADGKLVSKHSRLSIKY